VRARLALGLAIAAGCGPQIAEIDRIESAISGGQVAGTCVWPSTVWLPDQHCSGVLVHPQLVLYASHCGAEGSNVVIGETVARPVHVVPIERCQLYPAAGSSQTDWAFCKLRSPVADVPIVPVLMGCETELVQVGRKVVVAGFGVTRADVDDYGLKRFAETQIVRSDLGDGVGVGAMGRSPCRGDSGGPAYLRVADGTWRTFAIDSSGMSRSCGDGDNMSLIHLGVPWIERESGLDITPCHDADGTWHPGPSCRDFPHAPESPGRSWANGCAERIPSGPSITCAPDAGEPAESAQGGGCDVGHRRSAPASAALTVMCAAAMAWGRRGRRRRPPAGEQPPHNRVARGSVSESVGGADLPPSSPF
jgi:hypothetical protein